MKISLKEHQQIMRGMLIEVDRICRRHDISYMLFAGTALGAVRHSGFIPWDDDLDIAMLRVDYERFLSVAEQELDGDVWFLQKAFSAHWPLPYSKLRKQNTACMERFYPRDPQLHQGIYIDIFPIDNLSESRLMRKCQFVASKVVIAKGLYRRGYLTDNFKKKLFMQLCRLLPTRPFLRLAQQRKRTDSLRVHSFFGASSKYEKSVFLRAWFTKTVRVRFEGADFPISAAYDELLTALYGEYMTLPPESERVCKVHADIVDAETSYTQYLDEQRTREISVYTRSIR